VPVDDNVHPQLRILALEKQLQRTKQEYNDYRAFVSERLEKSDILAQINNDPSSNDPPARDDDTHYFDSYAQNGTLPLYLADQSTLPKFN
jgi:type I protein arginine methyltransferase